VPGSRWVFPTITSISPPLITQQEINNIVRDLKLSEIQSELLASRLNGRNLLEKGFIHPI
jgi:hypothetical protein